MSTHRFPSLLLLSLAGVALLAAASSSPAGADTLLVDGVCTLGDAIEAANTDETTVGGCVDTATGPDTLVLDVDTVLGAADLLRSTELEGAFAGLPDVTSEITIQAGLGDTVQRDASFDCDEPDPTDEFRLLQVRAGGDLTLDGLVLQNGCANDGGAVLVADGTLRVVDAVFRGNAAHASTLGAEGGAVWAGPASVVDVEGSTFDANRAIGADDSATGGAIRVRLGAVVSIDGSTFADNLAEGSSANGGALYDQGGVTNLSSSRFLRNRVLGSGGSGRAGAVQLSSPATLVDLVFDANVAEGVDNPGGLGRSASAGALKLDSGAIGADGAALRDIVFRNNVARGGDGDRGGSAAGGALESSVQITMSNVTFHDNAALGGRGETQSSGAVYGGAIFACELGTVDHLTVSGNTARAGDSTSGAGEVAFGGGLYIDCAPLVLRHATFADNEAVAGLGGAGDGTAEGGGLFAWDTISVESSLLEGNTTAVGAATTASDCENAGGDTYVTSLGYNVVGAPGDCDFTATADQTGVATSLLPLGDHGCTTPLVDGTCLPTHPVDLGTPALDAGSCTASMATEDARGLSRPWNAAPIDADDGCDAGAYEARDEDEGVGDGVEDGVDNCPADINADQADADVDGVGDVCDVCEGDDVTGDADMDGVCFDRDCDDADGLGISCWLFGDGFESGDTAAWGA